MERELEVERKSDVERSRTGESQEQTWGGEQKTDAKKPSSFYFRIAESGLLFAALLQLLIAPAAAFREVSIAFQIPLNACLVKVPVCRRI